MRVIFYGKLASTFGREVEVAVEHPSNIAALRTHLLKAYPDSKLSLENKRVRACVDGTIVSDEHPLDQGDTVEFLAPVSGG